MIEDIEKQLKEGGQSPHQLADFRVQLSAEYSHLAGMLEQILRRKPAVWNEIRKNCTSDKQSDKVFDATIDGLDEMTLRITMKRADKLISACSSLLRVFESEAKNQF